MTGHDHTGREPSRHRAVVKPTALMAALRRPRLTTKTVVLSAAALSVTSATALLAAGCDGGNIHASGAVATAASAVGKVASQAAGAAGEVADADHAADGNASASAGPGSASASAGAGAADASATASPAAQSPSASASAGSGAGSRPDPGTLPQTKALPSADDPKFQAGVQALWQAIVHDDPAEARGFFFPQAAYQQVKAIRDPAADYRDRLLAWYDLDIHAAHAQLGPGAANAKLVGVQVPTGQAQWIAPGAEFNKGSYYRVYGTRLTYQENGHTASFGIFSLISWRGEWYVVHLGPSTRSSNAGIVYEPKS